MIPHAAARHTINPPPRNPAFMRSLARGFGVVEKGWGAVELAVMRSHRDHLFLGLGFGGKGWVEGRGRYQWMCVRLRLRPPGRVAMGVNPRVLQKMFAGMSDATHPPMPTRWVAVACATRAETRRVPCRIRWASYWMTIWIMRSWAG